MTAARNLSLDLIKLLAEIQPREKMNAGSISEYEEIIRGAKKDDFPLPPIDVFHMDSDMEYLCADGFQRFHAAKQAQRQSIPCIVHRGTKRDAVLFACSSNSTHGDRRTNADKRRVVMRLLTDSEWKKKSVRWIAESCNVSHTFVANLKNELMAKESSPAPPPAVAPVGPPPPKKAPPVDKPAEKSDERQECVRGGEHKWNGEACSECHEPMPKAEKSVSVVEECKHPAKLQCAFCHEMFCAQCDAAHLKRCPDADALIDSLKDIKKGLTTVFQKLVPLDNEYKTNSSKSIRKSIDDAVQTIGKWIVSLSR